MKTVEMALLLPVIVLAILLPLYGGCRFYGACREAFKVTWDETYRPDQKIRMMQTMGAVTGQNREENR